MHSKIKILDKKTINKIAAGEVIERPASVVKELVENSIDANSSRIIIELEHAGKKLIRVTDNGDGIGPEELGIAFEKHSTSKITTIDDVYKLSTMGFRGEALASIASVARVECISSNGKNITGYKLIIEAGEVKSQTEVGCLKGTTIKVKDIFYNLPARLKYMKSNQTELAHIIDVVTHMAIFYNKVNFKVIHDGNELLNLPPTKKRIDNLVNIYGKELVRDLIPISYQGETKSEIGAVTKKEPIPKLEQEKELPVFRKRLKQELLNLTITGYLGKPSITRSDNSYQSLYVNGRYVENKIINNAIKEGYRTLVMKHRHPVVILFISINPEAVDVNIHPTKLQVRFESEELEYNEVLKAIKDTLKSHELITEAKIPSPPKPQAVTLKAITTLGIGKPGHPSTIPLPLSSKSQPSSNKPYDFSFRQSILKTDLKDAKSPNLPQTLIQPIGQILNTYIIAQGTDGMLIIDQHAAHERIMYERIKARYSDSSMATQELLEPVSLEFTLKELGFLKNNLEILHALSFVIDEMGNNSYYVKSIPVILGQLQDPEFIHDIINDLIMVTKEKEQDIIKDKMIQIMACKAAIKAGKPLTIHEMQQLLLELCEIENPFTCAHGRPTIISMSETQLKKMFKRIV